MKKMKTATRIGAGLAGFLFVASMAPPASAATGPELCGGTEYVRISAHEFAGGRLVVSKHRNSKEERR